MKRLIIILIVVLTTFPCWSQGNMDDYGKLSIGVYISGTNIPQEASRLLATKLSQIISTNGIAENNYGERFVITAKINVVSKDIVPTTPSRISQRAEITFMIGDVVENKVYQSLILTLTGIGENETKAYISSFNSIIPSSNDFKVFVESAKTQIVRYYENNGENIIRQVEDLARQNQHQRAIYLLSTIPNVANNVYRQAQEKIVYIYSEKMNYEARQALNQAKLTWAQSPDKEGAVEVANAFRTISTFSSLQPEIDALLNEITEKLKADEKQEWEFQMKQYEDNKMREQRDFEFRVQQHKDKQAQNERRYADAQEQARLQADLERQRYNDEKAYRDALLEAGREVALEYAKNQPQSIIYNPVPTW